MATNWILGKVSAALQPTIQGAVGTAGSFAGGAVNAVGSSINGVGESINSNIKYYGDGAKDYGNSIMDWTKAPGPRGQTAANPLGLSDNSGGGKRSVTNPNIYRAPPKSTASKTLTTTSKTTAPTSKPTGAVKKTVPKSTTIPKTGSSQTTSTGKKTISAASKPKAPVKASTATVTKAKVPAGNAKSSAGNPLGLSSDLRNQK